MTHDDANRWLQAYVDAWRSYEPESIGALFTDDASYRYHPWDEPLEGRDAIVADWLANRDDPKAWDADYEAWTVEGDRVAATGTSRYDDGNGKRTYHNVFLIEFDADGRCRAFTEVYAQER
jgi:nuclear transport factor 2 (NTF2) superfamily protein